jgi:hypothetical protein
MTTYTRKEQKVFTSEYVNAPDNKLGIFGSKQAGSGTEFSSDLNAIQGLSAFTQGFNKEVISGQAPLLEDFNSLFYMVTYQLAYLLQNVGEWLATTDYPLGAMVRVGTTRYMCTQVPNLGIDPATNANAWKEIALPSVWKSGVSYSIGDRVIHNRSMYECTSAHTSQTTFYTDYYAARWNDDTKCGSFIYSMSLNVPYGYFDVTGIHAGIELSMSTYANLYSVFQDRFNRTVNYSTGQIYPDVASGNFRLPDLRGVYLRGLSNGVVGQYEANENKNHLHTLTASSHTHKVTLPAKTMAASVTGAGGHYHYYAGRNGEGGGFAGQIVAMPPQTPNYPDFVQSSSVGDHIHSVSVTYPETLMTTTSTVAQTTMASQGDLYARPNNISVKIFIKGV